MPTSVIQDGTVCLKHTPRCVCWLEGMKTQQSCTLISLMIDQIVSLRASVFIINPAAQHVLAPAISILMGTRLWRATIPDVQKKLHIVDWEIFVFS